MDYLDKLIPLALLAIVAAFLAVLVRRVARDLDTAPRKQEAAKPPPLAVAIARETPPPLKIVPLRMAAPVVVAPVPVLQPDVAAPAVTSAKREFQPETVAPPKKKTPIQTVMNLLNEKDPVAVAFLLHEIFGPPVSKRNSK